MENSLLEAGNTNHMNLAQRGQLPRAKQEQGRYAHMGQIAARLRGDGLLR